MQGRTTQLYGFSLNLRIFGEPRCKPNRARILVSKIPQPHPKMPKPKVSQSVSHYHSPHLGGWIAIESVR